MSPEIVSQCPLCGSQISKMFDVRVFRGQRVTNQICQTCGLVFQSPRMSMEELDSYYAREYRLQYQGQEGPDVKDLATQRGRAESLTRFVQTRLLSVSRHLDIGCSAGLLLKQVQSAYQCQSTGIEPGEAYRHYAQQNGFNIYPSLEALKTAREARFDLISMAHVLEHLPDPVGYLSHLCNLLLVEDGHLLIEVPNLYGHECFETAHLVSYSAHTLSQVLKKAGFSVNMIDAHGRPRSEVIPLYLTALAHPTAMIQENCQVISEHRVILKRKIGMLRRRLLTKLVPRKAWHPVR